MEWVGFITFMLLLASPIIILLIVIIYKIMGRKRSRAFQEKYPYAAKICQKLPKNGTLHYEEIKDVNRKLIKKDGYSYVPGKKKRVLMIPPGKYNFQVRYVEHTTGLTGSTNRDYGITNLILNLDARKEYVLQIDEVTKNYNFFES